MEMYFSSTSFCNTSFFAIVKQGKLNLLIATFKRKIATLSTASWKFPRNIHSGFRDQFHVTFHQPSAHNFAKAKKTDTMCPLILWIKQITELLVLLKSLRSRGHLI
jgi:hypothetical protein